MIKYIIDYDNISDISSFLINSDEYLFRVDWRWGDIHCDTNDNFKVKIQLILNKQMSNELYTLFKLKFDL